MTIPVIAVLAIMFLFSGIVYFVSATRYIQFQKARHIRFDQEAAEWKEREEEKNKALLSAMGLSTGEPPEPITGLFNSPGFYDDFKVEFKEEPGNPEVQTAGSNDFVRQIPREDFEESGGRKKGEQWVNFVRTYWSERFEYETIVDDRMVYPSQSQATESAIRTAGHLGLDGHQYKIGNDYSIDDDLHRVILEWVTEKE